MADKLLIRAYNVEVGDCIYCRIPKGRKVGSAIDDFHILIDCGSVGPRSSLRTAVEHLESQLPATAGGKRRLDLLVVTHEHEDHIAGFDPEWFKNITIGAIWMNAAMDTNHPQAGRVLELHRLAGVAMRNLAALNLSLSPELAAIVALSAFNNKDAMKALRETLPTRSGITPKYVHAGMTPSSLGLPLNGLTIRVLGPERDIDHFYLGAEVDATLLAAIGAGAVFRERSRRVPQVYPSNISRFDFRRLQSRLLSTAFAFTDLSNKVKNNTSIVLLIEWKGKRLLFVGDAEWDTKFKAGKANGAWNVMWHERKDRLNAPIDFLKIGHHGSENATPWNDREDGAVTEASTILDAILPLPAAGAAPKAKAIVSTMRKNYDTIPRSALLVEIGKRVGNVRNYQQALGAGASDLPEFTAFEQPWLSYSQPLRTDIEHVLSETPFVDVEIPE